MGRENINFVKNGLVHLIKNLLLQNQVADKPLTRTQGPMILKFGWKHWEIKLYKVCINDDAWLTLIYFAASSNSIWNEENCYKVI